MRKIIHILLFWVVTSTVFTACGSDDPVDINEVNKQTVLVFMPWSGSQTNAGLYRIFLENLDSIEGSIVKNKGMTGRLMVFISRSATKSELYEVTYENKQISHKNVKTYTGTDYATPAGIAQILNDVKANAYALNYAMMIGCHGCGWTYKSDWKSYPYQAKKHVWVEAPQAKRMPSSGHQSGYFPTTRFFGSVTNITNAIDITDLAAGIQNAGMKMQFILFDDCYMANVETAYELRNATNFLIGSTSEVMAQGMPYQAIWKSLANATPAYAEVVSAFHSYYSKYTYPYGALSAVDCRELEALATIMREINKRYTLNEALMDSLQVLDGFKTPIFYDLGDYVTRLCDNPNLQSDFRATMDRVVRAKSNTDTLYSFLYSEPVKIKVKSYSGLTISDPSRNSVATKGRRKTSWWKATH